MNSVNTSTGFSNFQIWLGCSPHLIPPLIPDTLNHTSSDAEETEHAQKLIVQIQTDVNEAKDNLLQAKVFQSHYANLNRSPEIPFKISNKVMLLTLHCHQEFKKKGEKQATKFIPHYDGPYDIIDVHTETSNYTLELLNALNTYPTYQASKLKAFLPNDADLIPSHELMQLLPIVTFNGLDEFLIQEIFNSCRRRRGWQYLVCWVRYSPEHDCWLAGLALENCEA
jgi:hypothetical protein